MKTIQEHLAAYGLRLHRSHGDFQSSCHAKIPLGSHWWDTKQSLSTEAGPRYYDYIVSSGVANILQSSETGAIAAIGTFAQHHFRGRKRILDLGCGTGYLTTFLASRDETLQVVGVDFSSESIACARNMASHLEIHNVEFYSLDIRHELPPGPFDAILDTWTLVDDVIFSGREREAVFHLCGHVLAKDGVLLSVLHDDRNALDIQRFLNSMPGSGVCAKEVTFISGAPFQDAAVELYPAILAEPNPETIDVLGNRLLCQEDGSVTLEAASTIERIGLRPKLIPYLADALAKPDLPDECRWTLERTIKAVNPADTDTIYALTTIAKRTARVGLVIANALLDIDPVVSVRIVTSMLRETVGESYRSQDALPPSPIETNASILDANTLRVATECLTMSGLNSQSGRAALYAASRDPDKSVRCVVHEAIKNISTFLWLTLPIRNFFWPR